MSWLLGAGLGFLRGGPLGALLGGAVGHFITKRACQKVRQHLPGVADENLFVTCIVVVLTKLTLLKGGITASEVETIYRFFVRNLDYNPQDLEQVNKVIEETLRVNPDFEPVVTQYLKSGKGHYKELLLTLSYQIILVESELTPELQEEINKLARLLKLSYEQHDIIRRRYELDDLVTPFTLLEIPHNSNPEEIKKAYRRKAAEYHPDRVAHMGEVHAEAAHLKFLEIQQAYQELEQSGQF